MKVIGIIFNSIFLLIMLSVAGLFLLPYLPFDHGIELRIVESGSMEPAIMTGSLIVVRAHDAYQVGDVIMFDSPQANVPTTHRIVEVMEEHGQTQFITKGDANEEADPGVTYQNQVFGTVALAIPRVGFVLDFARQPIGFIFLIVLPALLIVFGEAEKIWREIRARRKESGDDENEGIGFQEEVLQPVPAEVVSKKPTRSMMDIATPVRRFELPTLDLRGVTPYKRSVQQRQSHSFPRQAMVVSVVVFAVLVVSSSFLGSTVSYFNDVEQSSDNSLGALALDVVAVSDGLVFNFIGDQIDDPDGAVVVTVSPESGSAAVHYDITTNVTGSSTPLCDAIVANAAAPANYTGSLPLLAASGVTFVAPWEIAFSLPDESGLSSAGMCSVDIVLTAWHFDEESGDGYFDEERVPLIFTYTAPITTTSFSLPTGFAAPIMNTLESLAPESEVTETVGEALDLLENMSNTFFDNQEGPSTLSESGDLATEEKRETEEPQKEVKTEESGEAAGPAVEEEGGEDTEDMEVTENTEETESSIVSVSDEPETREDKEVEEPQEETETGEVKETEEEEVEEFAPELGLEL